MATQQTSSSTPASPPITVTVIAAGIIPQCELREPDLADLNAPDRWFLPRAERDTASLPPRVLLEVSEEGARALAGWMYQEVELVVRPKVAQKGRRAGNDDEAADEEADRIHDDIMRNDPWGDYGR